eukprot:1179587-Prorocentrum_minimum.AAC.1
MVDSVVSVSSPVKLWIGRVEEYSADTPARLAGVARVNWTAASPLKVLLLVFVCLFWSVCVTLTSKRNLPGVPSRVQLSLRELTDLLGEEPRTARLTDDDVKIEELAEVDPKTPERSGS